MNLKLRSVIGSNEFSPAERDRKELTEGIYLMENYMEEGTQRDRDTHDV